MAQKEIKCKVGKGSFFINSFKEQEDHPDYKGSININGIPEELALWVRITDNDPNKTFLRCVCSTTKVTFTLKPVQKNREKDPDFNGTLEYEGKTYKLAGWMNETTETHVHYCSLSIKEKESGSGNATAPTGFPTFGNTNIYQKSPYPTSPSTEAPKTIEQGTEDIDQVPF